MNAELSTEILSIKIEEMNVFYTKTKLCSIFYNNPEHKKSSCIWILPIKN